MAKALRVIGVVASVAAMIPGPHQPFAAGLAVAANIGSQLAAKPPRAQGQVQGYMVGANQPLPYLIGEAYTEGVELYRDGFGGKVDKVQNPYAFIPRVLSCCGPIQSMGATLVDHQAIGLTGSVGSVQEATGYYDNFLYIDQQLGARPEADALTTPWGMAPGWSSAHKLSSLAAVGWSMLWDKKAERFAGGQIPPLGKVPQGVKIYDPRLDSTYPGGSGPCRLGDESTYIYYRCPALHSGMYAYGRYVAGKKVFGGGMGAAGVNWPEVVAWANVCDVNGWTANGTIYEPADKWNNLKRIAECGAGRPVLRGGVVGFAFQAPRTSLYTITKDDLASGAVTARGGKGFRERHNTLIARFRSPAHQWGYVQATAVSEAAFLAEDGEEKVDERQFDLVTNVDQATELITYDLWQRRAAGPITLTCKPHMKVFEAGDCLTLSAEIGAHPAGAIKVILIDTAKDPRDGTVQLIFEEESDAKHAAALGATGAAAAAAVLPGSAEMDAAWFTNAFEDFLDAHDRASAGLELDGTVKPDRVINSSVLEGAVYAQDAEYSPGSTAINNTSSGPYNTWITVASKDFTSTGREVLVNMGARVEVTDNCKLQYRLLCDAAQVEDALGPLSVNVGDQQPLSYLWAHTPIAGSHTYELQVQCNNNGIVVHNPVLAPSENRNI
ncbi:phage tail protein [Alteraurantiacibacter palmitatis]|uniref:Phage tail protein n=1 Tax=Alteraurantiacibacter palmitatis TaxID=2054628 RepID=A0ABV7E3T9_9SPHN